MDQGGVPLPQPRGYPSQAASHARRLVVPRPSIAGKGGNDSSPHEVLSRRQLSTRGNHMEWCVSVLVSTTKPTSTHPSSWV